MSRLILRPFVSTIQPGMDLAKTMVDVFEFQEITRGMRLGAPSCGTCLWSPSRSISWQASLFNLFSAIRTTESPDGSVVSSDRLGDRCRLFKRLAGECRSCFAPASSAVLCPARCSYRPRLFCPKPASLSLLRRWIGRPPPHEFFARLDHRRSVTSAGCSALLRLRRF